MLVENILYVLRLGHRCEKARVHRRERFDVTLVNELGQDVAHPL